MHIEIDILNLHHHLKSIHFLKMSPHRNILIIRIIFQLTLIVCIGCNKKKGLLNELSTCLNTVDESLDVSVVEHFSNYIYIKEGFVILKEENNMFSLVSLKELDSSIEIVDRGNFEISLFEDNKNLMLFDEKLINKKRIGTIIDLELEKRISKYSNERESIKYNKKDRGKYFEFPLPYKFSSLYLQEIFELIKIINLKINKYRDKFSKKYFKTEFKFLPEESRLLVTNIFPKVFYIYISQMPHE